MSVITDIFKRARKVERHPRLEPPRADIFQRNGTMRIGGRKIGHLISLGTHCLASSLLKKHGLKRYSTPFDWVFMSPDAVLHCLTTDFSYFLDRRYYSSLTKIRPGDEPGAQHMYYKEHFGVDSVFAHHDPIERESFRYYSDCGARIRRVFRSDEAKLFLMIARSEHDAVRAFPKLSCFLNSATENIGLICVQMRENTGASGQHSMRLLDTIGSCHLFEFQPSSADLGVGFVDQFDELAIIRLVQQYDIDLAAAP